MFKTNNSKKALAALAMGLVLIFTLAAEAQIEVSLPDTSVERGTSVWIPVITTDVDPMSFVFTYEFSIDYDNLVAAAYDTFDHTGTITPATWTLHNYAFTLGNIYGNSGDITFVNALAGAGPLVYFRFDIPEDAIGTTELAFQSFEYGGFTGAIYPTMVNGSITISNPNVTVDGYCYLQGYSDHSGTMIVFEAVSPNAQTDTAYTDAGGYYQKELVVGTYNVYFTHEGFGDQELLDQAFLDDTTLPEITMQPVVTGNYLSGALAGILMEDSTYIVNGDIWVENGAHLTIEPGVTLLFDGAFSFTIEGYLIASGTEDNGIVFQPNEVDIPWEGIKFLDSADDNSVLEYCTITGSEASGIHLTSASPAIAHCDIRENTSAASGGGVVCAYGSSPLIDYCVIEGNSALSGSGGGILCYESSNPSIKQCTIYGNSATTFGSGIQIQSNSAPSISNSIVNGNTHQGINFTAPHNAVVTYCDVYGNTAGNYTGSIPAGMGQLTAANNNGDPCDIYFNISMDPLFAGPLDQSPFELTENSPCIDAGDPASAFDPDGTIADMGTFYYHQDPPPAPENLTAQAVENTIELAWEFNAVYDLDYFNIYRGTDPNPTTILTTVDYPTLSYIDDDIQSGITYYYRLDAVGENGLISGYSNEVDAIATFNVVIYVPGDYPTIQAAIDAANDGDSVLVADGTYTGPGNKNIDFLSKAIVVISENGADNCIIDCENDGRGFIFQSGETSEAVLAGFTIINGSAEHGAGIYCEGSSPTIQYCVLIENSAVGYGGGIHCTDSSSPTIESCTISGNYADDGGGIACYSSSPTIVNTIVEGGAATDGIYFYDSPDASVTYCDFYNNEYGDFSGFVPAGLGTITTVNANGDPCDDFYNIFLDPLFVGADDSPYELQWNSPCVDAGDPASPPDPDGTVADMGAYPLDHNALPPIVSLPEVTVTAGTSIEIAVYAQNINAANNYLSYNMGITFDSAVAEASAFTIANTITPANWITDFTLDPGEITGGAWQFLPPPLEGEGDLVFFTFDVPLTAYGQTDLTFEHCVFGDDEAIMVNGQIIVQVPEVTIDGYCYLANQTDHSGTTVSFEAVSGGAVSGSDITDESGYYTATLSAGTYDVSYTHDEYEQFSNAGVELYATQTLDDVTLYRLVTGLELSGEIGGLILQDTTYTVIDNIWISAGLETYIQPGATLLFTDNTEFDVNGLLNSVGTETDSIKFTPFSAGETWGGIDFNDTASDDSRLEYCLITGGFASGNWPENCGGGISCYNSSPAISNCTISGNTANDDAGGIYCYYSSPAISNCTISGNTASSVGGGIYCLYSSSAISNCTISGNTANHGGGIYCSYPSPAISNCTISGNTATGDGGGIYCIYSSPTVLNTIIESNSGNGGVYFDNSPNAVLTYSDFYNNAGANFVGSVPAGLGTITTTNFNGDPCDDYNNIFLDPAFVGGGDYNLTAGSPCIDAGDPASDPDPDGTIADMGAYYYHQDIPPAPYNLTAEAVEQTIELNWEWTDYDIDSFNIYRGTSPEPTELYDTVDYPTMTYIDDDIQSTVTYYYRVTALGHNGLESDYSNQASGMAQWTVTIHIPGDYPTIQAGIDAANDGDSVLVADGVYTGIGNKDLDYGGRAIVVMSENGAENCVIDCEGDGRGFIFQNGEDENSVLNSFTIINGSAEHGGAIYCTNSSPTIDKCVLDENSATGYGGGIHCTDSSSPTIENCTLSRNYADDGGGIACYSSSPTIVNTIVEGGAATDGIYFYDSQNASVTYCDFYNNEYGNFSGFVPAGLGTITTTNYNGAPCDQYYNIYLDPLFVGPILDQSPYELQPGSPCIDAGDPASPPDPDGSIADMGAYYLDHSLIPPVVWFPDTTVTAGNSIVLPLMTSNIDSNYYAYLSYTMNVVYDPDKALAVDYDLTGTITPSNWMDLNNIGAPGQLQGGCVGFAGPSIHGEGALVYYTFDVPITSFGETDLHFESFVYDDYTPETTDGSITIQVPEFIVDGNCQLGDQTSHTGIMVRFAAVSGGAITDTAYTDALGDYEITLNAGIYNVYYIYEGYGTVEIEGQEIFEAATLPNVVLYPPPSNFGLIAPEYGSTVRTLDTTLVWEESIHPNPQIIVHYDVWLDTLEDLSTMWQVADSIPDTFLDLLDLTDDMTYYWTVRATDANSPGTWADDTLMFDTYMPEAPAGFALSEPYNGAVLHTDTVEVSWEASSDPDPGDVLLYAIDWSIDPAFAVYLSDTTDETTYTITDILSMFDELPDDITVFWRVKAFDSYGLETWSDAGEAGWSFTIDIFNPPNAFGLTAPANGDTTWLLEALLEWEESIDPDPYDTTHYDVWADTLEDLSTMWQVADSIGEISFNLANLDDDQTYYWTIRATDSNTPGTWSDDTLMFHTYLPEAPGAFSHLSPDSGAVFHVDTVEVSWNESIDPDPGDAIAYIVEWSTDSTFAVFDSYTTNLTTYTIADITAMFDELPDDVTVYWRVRAVDSFGLLTWSDAGLGGWSFSIDVYNEPAPFSLLEPAYGDTVWALEATLVWEESIDPDPYDTPHYDIRVGTMANFNDAWLEADSIAETSYEFTNLMDDTTYYWTVRATDSNTPGTWSIDTLMFRTYLPEAPGAFALTSPDSGAVIHDDTVTVSWNASVDPDPGDVVQYVIDWTIDPAFAVYESDTTSATSYSITDILAMFDELPDDIIIYWRVRAVDSFGIETWSDAGLGGWSFSIDIFNAPEPFALLEPAYGDTVWNPEVTLTWEESADPDPYDTPHYDVRVATLANFNDAWLEADSIPETSFLFINLLDDTTYYWTVRATDSNTPGTWSDDTLMFRTYFTNPPGEFALIDPPNGSVVHDDTVEVSWTESIDPDPGDIVQYVVEWSTDSTFAVFDSYTTTLTTYAITDITAMFDELPDDVTVYWRVMAFDNYGNSTWSNAGLGGWSFSIDVYNEPEPFALLEPAFGDTVWALEATLVWEESIDPDPYDTTNYDVRVATLANFNDAWLEADSIPETSFLFTNLLDDTTYYWTVRATDSNTPGTWSDDTLMFRTYLIEAPGAFALSSPDSGAVIHDDTVEVSWNASVDPDPGDVVQYVIDWTIDSTFTAYESDTTAATSYTITNILAMFDELPDDIIVYWRVRAFDSFVMETWSDAGEGGWSFSIDIFNSPAPFALLEPAFGDTVWVLEATLVWEESIDPDPYDTTHYDVRVATLANFNDAWLEADSIPETSFLFTNLLDDTTYYWTVRATDSNTPGTWSDDTLMFRTYLPEAPGAFALVSPDSGAVIHDDTVEVSWNASVDPDPSDVVEYVVEWSLDPTFAVFDSDTTDQTAYTIDDITIMFDELPDDITVFWRVRAFDSFGLETWSDAGEGGWSFSIDIFNSPEPFALIEPAFGDTVFILEAALIWEESSDPDPYDTPLYDVWLDTLPDLSTAWMEAENLEDTSYTVSELGDNLEYYWTVYATDSNTPGTWSTDTLMFRTYLPEAPGAFALVSPDSGAVIHDDTVMVSWNASVDPDPGDMVEYVVEWSLDAGFATFDSDTTADTTYTITVIGELLCGSNNPGGIAGEIEDNRLDGNAAGKGANSAVVLEGESAFSFNSAPGSGNLLDALPDDETIYWRVRAVDSYALFTWANDDSSGWSFSIDLPDPPDPFNLASPANGDTIWTTEAELIWNAATDPDPYDTPLYDVWLDTLPDLSTAWMEAENLEDTTYTVSELGDNTDYYWTVYATDSNTPGTWASDTSMFWTYFPEPLEAFSLLLPENGAVLAPGLNTFTWETAYDPDPGDEADYTIWFLCGGDSVGYSTQTDTTVDIDTDTVLVLAAGGEATWYVTAHSDYPDMTIESDERFTFTLTLESITDLVVSIDGDDIVLSWTAPAGTQGNYIIYRDVIPYFEISAAQSVFTYTGPTTGEVIWVDLGALAAGINYFYIVTHEILPETAGSQSEPQGIPKENTRQ